MEFLVGTTLGDAEETVNGSMISAHCIRSLKTLTLVN